MKKQLIDMMIEAGVKWPDGAEYAAQDKESNDLCFYKNEPKHVEFWPDQWRSSDCEGIVGIRITLPSLCAKWRSTLVTREQYEQALTERRPEQVVIASNPSHAYSFVLTIEQRIASLRELEKQVEETRAKLTRDLEALGLTWTVRGEPEQPTITDWRDLRVGDVIWISESTDASNAPSGEYSITATELDDPSQPVQVEWSGGKTWPNLTKRQWRFIRRP